MLQVDGLAYWRQFSGTPPRSTLYSVLVFGMKLNSQNTLTIECQTEEQLTTLTDGVESSKATCA